jgi:hypothetical protein
MKLRNQLLKATIFKDNHNINTILNFSNDDNDGKMSGFNSLRSSTDNYLRDMDSVLEELSKKNN